MSVIDRFRWLHIYILLCVEGIFVPKPTAINIHIFVAENFKLKKLYIYMMLHLWWLMISHSFFFLQNVVLCFINFICGVIIHEFYNIIEVVRQGNWKSWLFSENVFLLAMEFYILCNRKHCRHCGVLFSFSTVRYLCR